MKTALIIASSSRNGGGLFDAERRFHQTLAAHDGVETGVFALEDRHAAEDAPQWAPLRPRLFRPVGPRAFGYAPGLGRAMQEFDPDLCYAAGLWQYPSYAALQWVRRKRRPLVVTPHGMLDSWALQHSRWKKRLAAWAFQDSALKSATCLRALCESEAQSIRAYGLRNPIAIIPNGIDLPAEPLTSDLGPRSASAGGELSAFNFQLSNLTGSGRKVLLYLGRIHPKKGLINLLKAWSEVRGQRSEVGGHRSSVIGQPEWILAIAGWDQGGHEAELERLATELGLSWADVRDQKSEVRSQNAAAALPSPISHLPSSTSVVFLGPQFGEAKTACYRDCDAFILPSFSEGLPMVVLEAWAHGKPVLMTPECNLPEGFAADAAIRIEPSAESIAQGLGTLFQSSISDLQSAGTRGRSLVAGRFAWPRIAADMKSVYDWLLGGGPAPSCVVFK